MIAVTISASPCAKPNLIVNRIRQAFDRWLHNKYVLLFTKIEYDGFQLFFRGEDVESVISGLKLLKELSPQGYKRAKRFVPTIVDTDLPTHYDQAAEACYLNILYTSSPVDIAAAIVHEATHGYLRKARHMRYQGMLKEKEERICLSQQGKFMNVYLEAFAGGDVEKCKEAWTQYANKSVASGWWQRGRLRDFMRLLQAWKDRKERDRNSGVQKRLQGGR